MKRFDRFCFGLIFALLAVIPAPAGAQSGSMQSIIDPKGRFTIDFPADWHVLKPESGVVAVLGVAIAPGGPNPASVNVVVEELPRPMSPETYAILSERMLRTVFHDYTPIQQGSATIAEQPAFYRYYTWQTNTGRVLYQVQVYFTAGRRGFVVTGSTLNHPDYTRRYVPIIARIIDTFHPAAAGLAPGREPAVNERAAAYLTRDNTARSTPKSGLS